MPTPCPVCLSKYDTVHVSNQVRPGMIPIRLNRARVGPLQSRATYRPLVQSIEKYSSGVVYEAIAKKLFWWYVRMIYILFLVTYLEWLIIFRSVSLEILVKVGFIRTFIKISLCTCCVTKKTPLGPNRRVIFCGCTNTIQARPPNAKNCRVVHRLRYQFCLCSRRAFPPFQFRGKLWTSGLVRTLQTALARRAQILVPASQAW